MRLRYIALAFFIITLLYIGAYYFVILEFPISTSAIPEKRISEGTTVISIGTSASVIVFHWSRVISEEVFYGSYVAIILVLTGLLFKNCLVGEKSED